MGIDKDKFIDISYSILPEELWISEFWHLLTKGGISTLERRINHLKLCYTGIASYNEDDDKIRDLEQKCHDLFVSLLDQISYDMIFLNSIQK